MILTHSRILWKFFSSFAFNLSVVSYLNVFLWTHSLHFYFIWQFLLYLGHLRLLWFNLGLDIYQPTAYFLFVLCSVFLFLIFCLALRFLKWFCFITATHTLSKDLWLQEFRICTFLLFKIHFQTVSLHLRYNIFVIYITIRLLLVLLFSYILFTLYTYLLFILKVRRTESRERDL